MRAAQYRQMAATARCRATVRMRTLSHPDRRATARTADTQDALLRLAQQYDELADKQTASLKEALGLR